MPDPVCQTLSGKCSSSFPMMTSLEAAIIALEIFLGSCFSLKCTVAAAFFIIAIDFIKTGRTKKSPISKYFFDLCVEAVSYTHLTLPTNLSV